MTKNKKYLTNKNATKNPKLFTLTLLRDERGVLHALGNNTMMLDRSKRQEKWVNVNTRDFVSLLNKQGVVAA
jgi:hypothetical protein